ncbi:hypothetical protein HDN1F_09440 [gamma proteobacterium HdN1]|nr:hypothetical protein HDN1F_09440 [gamma proteobacterium HdN1]
MRFGVCQHSCAPKKFCTLKLSISDRRIGRTAGMLIFSPARAGFFYPHRHGRSLWESTIGLAGKLPSHYFDWRREN